LYFFKKIYTKKIIDKIKNFEKRPEEIYIYFDFLKVFWYPFPAPFLGKGVKRKVFLTKMVFEGRATTQSLYLFKKCLTKKKLFETKNA